MVQVYLCLCSSCFFPFTLLKKKPHLSFHHIKKMCMFTNTYLFQFLTATHTSPSSPSFWTKLTMFVCVIKYYLLMNVMLFTGHPRDLFRWGGGGGGGELSFCIYRNCLLDWTHEGLQINLPAKTYSQSFFWCDALFKIGAELGNWWPHYV